MSFPSTGILDDFQRANEGPPPSASWTSGGMFNGTPGLKVSSNTCVQDAATTGGFWGSMVGPDSEEYFTFATPVSDGSEMQMAIRTDGTGTTTWSGYWVRWERSDAGSGGIGKIFRMDTGVSTQLGSNYTDSSGVAASGDKLGTSAVGSDITLERKLSAGSWATLMTRTDATYGSSGFIGIRPNDGTFGTVLDDFGGGTVAAGTGLAWITA